MTAPDFPPEVIEKAARALSHHADWPQAEGMARAVLAAVADWMNDCDAEALRRNRMHDRLVQEARVEGARQVLAAVEDVPVSFQGGNRAHRAAREAVARIEKESQ